MNALATFQVAMNDIFIPYLRKFVLVFFDDILIYSKTWEEHLQHLQLVLSILQRHSFFVNLKKCSFGRSQVEYLGHVLSEQGVAVDQMKVKTVLEWPMPKSIKGLRGFLGLTGYYRKFIKNYGKVAKPLTDLLKKGAFSWNEEAQQAFEQQRLLITEALVLALLDFSKSFAIECDASGKGIGVVLLQESKPIAYFSKVLADRTAAKSTYEKELIALVLSVQHWRPYLLGENSQCILTKGVLNIYWNKE